VDDKRFLSEYFERYREALFATDVHSQLVALKELFRSTMAAGGKVIMQGNGGSAAIAGHCAVDLTKNGRIRCVTFNSADLITCLANDYGHERWIEKALELYADDCDLVVLISSSGRSMNMLRAADYTLARGLPLVTFTGFAPDNALRQRGRLNFWVDSQAYNVVEMTHHIWLLAVCDLIIGRAEYSVS
jgi:D-sedoheptulose 7-phosphate isomerase